MLQNTSMRIKRFITQQQCKSVQDLDDEKDDLLFSNYHFSNHGSRRSSWVSESPFAEEITNQQSNSNTTIPNHTHLSDTAHSSMSSFCSCDCKVNPVPIKQSLSRIESVMAQQEVLYPDSKITNNVSEDAETRRSMSPRDPQRPFSLISAAGLKHSRRKSFLAITPIDTINVFSDPEFDNDKTPIQSIKYISDLDMEDLSANVEQLIRETDEAFKAVGTALAEAKAVTGWYDTGLGLAPPPISISRGIMRQSISSVPVSPHSSPITKPKPKPKLEPKVVVATKGIPKKSLSVKKKKSTLFNRTKPSISQLQNSATTSRWNLNDVTANMVDVFSGRRFRVEADEMLTPLRTQELKDRLQIAVVEDDRRISGESSRSNTSTETARTDGDEDIDCVSPTEPFHLEKLSERIDAVNRAGTPPSIIITSETTPSSVPILDADTTLPHKAAMKDVDIAFPFPTTTQAKSDMKFESFSFPEPPPIPPRNPRRVSSLTKGLPPLPTIPEVSPLNLSPTPFLDFLLDSSPTSSSTHIPISTPPPSYTLLPSTKYSLLSPNFHHGAIRLEKSGRRGKEEVLKKDEQEKLDWVAFQMAISGNMDEYVGSERRDGEWELAEVEIDEIMAWWEGFGFGLGGFIEEEEYLRRVATKEMSMNALGPALVEQIQAKEGIKTSTPSETRERGSTPSSKELDHLTSTPSDEDLPQDPAPPYTLSLSPPSAFEAPLPPPPITAPPNSRPPPAAEYRGPSTASSMPPSPMLDLGLLSPKDEELIPMGFNLGHDLGDFLRWETDHVRAFYEG